MDTAVLKNVDVDNQLIPDYTPLLRGREKYSQLRKHRYLQYLTSDLIAREVSIPTLIQDKIRGLVKLLKLHEGDETSFKPVTDINNSQHRFEPANVRLDG